jgi:serine/threonine protein phosphatase PrpC
MELVFCVACMRRVGETTDRLGKQVGFFAVGLLVREFYFSEGGSFCSGVWLKPGTALKSRLRSLGSMDPPTGWVALVEMRNQLMEGQDNDAITIPSVPSFADHLFASESIPYRVVVKARTHRGYHRACNEDHFAVLHRRRSCELIATSLPADSPIFQEDEGYLLMVADGMGGNVYGEYASRLAINTVLELAARSTTWIMKFTENEQRALKYRVDAYLERLQQRFRECYEQEPACRGMGTTMTSAHLIPPHLAIMHVGDSRAYLYRAGHLTQLTRDHTVAQNMIDAGAAPHEVQKFAHLLTNRLGGDTGPVDVQIQHVGVQTGDRILLCTDGLSNGVTDPQLTRLLGGVDLEEIVQVLIAAALAAGGQDNITVVLAEVQAVQPPVPEVVSDS